MSMDLVLWRHAQAVDAVDGDDLGRALTPKGVRQAERIARWLDGALPASTRVLVSPARRTLQTAAALRRSRATCDAVAPGAGVQALLDAAGWPDRGDTVLVVGHQPTLGQVAARLLLGARPDLPTLRIPKGAVWWFRDDGRGGATLVAVRPPDMG